MSATVADTGSPPAARMPWSWRLVALVAVIGAGGLLALVVAQWGWRWLGPSSPAVFPDRKLDASAQEIVAAAPFGRAPAAAPAASAAAAASATLPADARLLGVYAGAAGSGYALFRLPDRGPLLVRRGDDIVAGVTLEAVRPDGVRIRDRGASRDLLLRNHGPAAAASPPPATGAPAPQPAATPPAAPSGVRPAVARIASGRSAACTAPPGFTGAVYKLNAELLSGMAAQPQSWVALLEPGPTGLVVRENNGLAAMLGMKAGDRFVQANGIALNAIDDVLAGVVKPLVASQPVRLTGTRDGKPREWLFLNAGACPA